MSLTRFLRDRKASVVPMLGISLVPLIAGIGAAVDYSRASTVRSSMQAAGDATALMLARSPSILSGNQLQQYATTFFQANFNRPEAQNCRSRQAMRREPAASR